MANRANPYEAAFEEYLRDRGVAYVAVDESRRTRMAEASLKSLDYLVSSAAGGTWLVDVKGRRFPSGEQKQYWRNWTTRDDLLSLAAWEELFGPRAQALFVFAYKVVGRRAPLPAEQLYRFRGTLYGFVGIRLSEYVPYARLISPKWDTLAMSTRRFRQLAEPFETLLTQTPQRAATQFDPARLRSASAALQFASAPLSNVS
jgi:hypothetical protein